MTRTAWRHVWTWGASVALVGSLATIPALDAGAVVAGPVGNAVTSAHTFFGYPPQLESVTSSAYRQGGRYHQAVAATWNGGYSFPTLRVAHSLTAHVPTGPQVSFRCALLYGYGAPSSFTVTTTGTTCRFDGLKIGTSYGIEVWAVVNYGESVYVSPGASAFAPLPRVTYRCVRRHHTRTYKNRTTLSCPAGWRLR